MLTLEEVTKRREQAFELFGKEGVNKIVVTP